MMYIDGKYQFGDTFSKMTFQYLFERYLCLDSYTVLYINPYFLHDFEESVMMLLVLINMTRVVFWLEY